MKKNINVTKSSGEKAIFSREKLRKSLQKAGADTEQIDFILKEVLSNLYEGIATKKIYKQAYALLKNGSRHFAARYHLKQAIMELGPSGYSFEKFIAEILTSQGFKTKISQIVQGRCVSHEIDVIAEKEDYVAMIECKYHNLPSVFSDVKIPLYINSRFKDVDDMWSQDLAYSNKKRQAWLVTNTRFSSDALLYGNCAGMHLLGWDYPIIGSLKDQIDTQGLYPITCLSSLTKNEKQSLLDKKIVLCKELENNQSVIEQLIHKPARVYTVMKEAEQLCKFVNKNGTK